MRNCRRRAYALMLLGCLSRPALADPRVGLAADLNTQPRSERGVASGLLAVGSRVLFSFEFEPWVSDGTAAGTHQLVDVCGDVVCGASLLGSLGDRALLATGAGIWSTRGVAGDPTFLIAGSPYGGALIEPEHGRAFILVRDPALGLLRVWVTDGTAGGTRRLAELPTAGLDRLHRIGARLFVSHYKGEVWTLDLVDGATRRLALDPLAGVPIPLGSGVILITQGPWSTSATLWWHDGVAAEPVQVAALPGNVIATAVAGSRLYLAVSEPDRGEELWETAGTTAGTRRLSSFAVRNPFSGKFSITPANMFQVAGKRLLMPLADVEGVRWWWTISPGQRAPRRLRGCPGGCPSVAMGAPARSLGSRVVFTGATPGDGSAVFVTNGKGPTTTALPLPPDSEIGTGQVVHQKLLVQGGGAVWMSDGSAAGTVEVIKRNKVFMWGTFNGSRWWLGLDDELWVSDGTAAGTRFVAGPLVPANGDSGAIPLADLGTLALAQWGLDTYGVEPGGSVKPLPLPEGRFAAAAGGTAVFETWSGQPWTTNGTPAGTRALLGPGAYAAADFQWVRAWQGELVFAFGESRPTGAYRLGRYGWEQAFQSTSRTVGLVPAKHAGDDFLFYTGAGLWRWPSSGGTPEQVAPPGFGNYWLSRLGDSTVRHYGAVHHCPAGKACAPLPEIGRTQPQAWLPHGGNLYVVTDAASDRRSSLWRIDAAGGVERLASDCGDVLSGRVSDLVGLEASVAWRCDAYGAVWLSDGTAAGTRHLWVPPPVPSRPGVERSLAVFGGVLYFSGWDPLHGWELWQSDGTAAGTRLVHDIAPGPASSRPAWLLAGEHALYFTAWDPEHGRELWVARP